METLQLVLSLVVLPLLVHGFSLLPRKVETYENRVNPGLPAQHQSKDQRLEKLEQTLQERDVVIQGLVDRLESHALILERVQEDHRQAKGSERQRRFVVDGETPIAFHATNNQNEVAHVGINQSIVFENIHLNLGGGYHVNHGTFIAPVPGVYMFSASVASGWHNDKDEFDASIVKNGVGLANVLGHGDSSQFRSDQGSVTVTVQLAAADEVWVKILWPSDTSLNGRGFTSFTGFLISPL